MRIHIRVMCGYGMGNIWIDMGMMGRLTERDKDLIAEAVKGVAANDVALILEVVMALGEFQGRPDQSELYRDSWRPVV